MLVQPCRQHPISAPKVDHPHPGLCLHQRREVVKRLAPFRLKPRVLLWVPRACRCSHWCLSLFLASKDRFFASVGNFFVDILPPLRKEYTTHRTLHSPGVGCGLSSWGFLWEYGT